jgi:hypothetical protein
MLNNDIIDILIENINIKLTGGCEIEYDGISLNLKKNNLEYCLYVSSNEHKVFDHLLVIDSFIDGLQDLKERCE